jgi:hypothetical protein
LTVNAIVMASKTSSVRSRSTATASTSHAADPSGPHADGSGSVRLTASTQGTCQASSQPRSAGLPPSTSCPTSRGGAGQPRWRHPRRRRRRGRAWYPADPAHRVPGLSCAVAGCPDGERVLGMFLGLGVVAWPGRHRAPAASRPAPPRKGCLAFPVTPPVAGSCRGRAHTLTTTFPRACPSSRCRMAWGASRSGRSGR